MRAPYIEVVDNQIYVSIKVDSAYGSRCLSHADLSAWRSDLLELLPCAVANLRARTTKCFTGTVGPAGEVWAYRTDDGLAASRILILPDMFDALPAKGLVASVPSANELLYIKLDGPEVEQDMLGLLAATQQAFQMAEQPLSHQLFWFDRQRWSLLRIKSVDGGLSLDSTAEWLEAIRRSTAVGMAVNIGVA
jgi:hypothetical protein